MNPASNTGGSNSSSFLSENPYIGSKRTFAELKIMLQQVEREILKKKLEYHKQLAAERQQQFAPSLNIQENPISSGLKEKEESSVNSDDDVIIVPDDPPDDSITIDSESEDLKSSCIQEPVEKSPVPTEPTEDFDIICIDDLPNNANPGENICVDKSIETNQTVSPKSVFRDEDMQTEIEERPSFTETSAINAIDKEGLLEVLCNPPNDENDDDVEITSQSTEEAAMNDEETVRSPLQENSLDEYNEEPSENISKSTRKRLLVLLSPLRSKKPKIDYAENRPDSAEARESDSERTPPKNIDKNCHAHSDLAKKCQICNKSFAAKHIVLHYAHQHPSNEVYCSRLENEKAEKIRNTKSPPIDDCLVCGRHLKEKSHEDVYTHYTIHTGEYLYTCSQHGKVRLMTHNQDDVKCKVSQTIQLNGMLQNDVKVMMCTECNFIALNESTIMNHLQNQHDFIGTDEEDLLTKYCTIITVAKRTSNGVAGSGPGQSIQRESESSQSSQNSRKAASSMETNKNDFGMSNSSSNTSDPLPSKAMQLRRPSLSAQSSQSAKKPKIRRDKEEKTFDTNSPKQTDTSSSSATNANSSSSKRKLRPRGVSSRLPSKMAENLRNGTPMQFNHCIFCDILHENFSRRRMLLHYTKFTKEFMFWCESHKKAVLNKKSCQSSKCNVTALKIVERKLLKKYIAATICNQCELVQIRKANVIKHLRTEHGIKGIDEELEKKYTTSVKILSTKTTIDESMPSKSIEGRRSSNRSGQSKSLNRGSARKSVDSNEKSDSVNTMAKKLPKRLLNRRHSIAVSSYIGKIKAAAPSQLDEVNADDHSNNETGSDEVNIKNVDKACYAKPQNLGQLCPLCPNRGAIRRIVNHFVNEHPSQEVFCSRLSPAMTKKVAAGKFKVKQCPFCDDCKYLEAKREDRLVHITMYTGEYMFRCSLHGAVRDLSHNKDNTNCKKTETREYKELLNADIIMTVCKECSYVQVNERRVVDHLQNQHDFTESYEELIANHTMRIMVLPKNAPDDETTSEDDFSDTHEKALIKSGTDLTPNKTNMQKSSERVAATSKKAEKSESRQKLARKSSHHSPSPTKKPNISLFSPNRKSKDFVSANALKQVDSAEPKATENVLKRTETTELKESASSLKRMERDEPSSSKQTESVEQTVTATEVRPKNTNKNCYAYSDLSKICQLCPGEKSFPNIVNHYVKEHEGSEVFSSRLREDVAKELIESKLVPVDECIFCDCCHPAGASREKWILYFSKYTGEYMFQCVDHGKVRERKHGSDRPSCIKAERPELKDMLMNDCMASICNECYYIQYSEQAVINHLKTEHEFGGTDEELKAKYSTRVTLLPKPTSGEDTNLLVPSTSVASSKSAVSENSDLNDENRDSNQSKVEKSVATVEKETKRDQQKPKPIQNRRHTIATHQRIKNASKTDRKTRKDSRDVRRNEGRIKNTDKNCYPFSDSWQTCRLCQHYKAFIVPHYVRDHPRYEVFCARVSPKMAETLRKRDLLPMDGCIFCDDLHETYARKKLLLHITQFSGEYMYECNTHGKVRDLRNCSIKCETTERADLEQILQDDLMVSICNECNFVQLDESNIFDHLRSEHGITGTTNKHLKANYTTRVMIAAKHASNDVSFGSDGDLPFNGFKSSEAVEPIAIEKETETVSKSSSHLQEKLANEQPESLEPKATERENKIVDESPKISSRQQAKVAEGTIDESMPGPSKSIEGRRTSDRSGQCKSTNASELSVESIRSPSKAIDATPTSEPSNSDQGGENVEKRSEHAPETSKKETHLSPHTAIQIETTAPKKFQVGTKFAKDYDLAEQAKKLLIELPILPRNWINIKPWIEIRDLLGKKETLSIKTLFALYKCAHPMCGFSTNNAKTMETHIEFHEKAVNVLIKLSQISVEMQMKYLYCCYCDTTFGSGVGLVQHIQNIHGESVFQCNLCFYRTVEINNLIRHGESYHGQRDMQQMLLCDGERRISRDDLEVYLRKSKSLLRCGRCDFEGCFDFFEFFEHLASQHPNQPYLCGFKVRGKVCNASVGIGDVEQHLETHNLAEFQCIHCRFGRRDVDLLVDHMTDRHPEKYLFFAGRRVRNSSGADCLRSLINAGSYLSMQFSDYEVYKCPPTVDLDSMSPHQLKQKGEEPESILDCDKVEQIPKIQAEEEIWETCLDYDEYKRTCEIAKETPKPLQTTEIQPENHTTAQKISTSPLMTKEEMKMIDELKQHMGQIPKSLFISADKLYVCSCKFKASTANDFETHLKAGHEKRFKCPHCQLNIESGEASKHIARHATISKYLELTEPSLNRLKRKSSSHPMEPDPSTTAPNSATASNILQYESSNDWTPRSYASTASALVQEKSVESSNTSGEFLGFEEERELNQTSDTTADDFREKCLDENENETPKRPLHTNQSSCENSSSQDLYSENKSMPDDEEDMPGMHELSKLSDELLKQDNDTEPNTSERQTSISAETENKDAEAIQNISESTQSSFSDVSINTVLICSLCHTCFPSGTELKEHFAVQHSNHLIAARVAVENIAINSTALHLKTVKTNFHYRRKYKCVQPQCETYCITKKDIVQHHYDAHRSAYLEFQMTPPSVFSMTDAKENEIINENQQFDARFVYTCPHTECKRLCFSSRDAVKQHSAIHFSNFRFSIEKLFKCLHCQSIGTVDMLFNHFQTLGMNNSINSARFLTDELLLSLNDGKICVDYYFAFACCRYRKFRIEKFGHHMMKCATIPSSVEELIERIEIIFENGFLVKLKYLTETKFGKNVLKLINASFILHSTSVRAITK